MTLRERYDEGLEEIKSDILHMASTTGEMVRLAVDSLVLGDHSLSDKVVEMDDEVDTLEQETLQKTVQAVAMTSPVARDLRLLVSTLGVIGEIEKVADDAVKLARRASKLNGHFPAELKKPFAELGEEVRLQLSSAIRLYVDYDRELADKVEDADIRIDELYSQARDQLLLLIQKDPSNTNHLARAVEAFHALEHMADHAVEIACRLRIHNETTSPKPVTV